MSKITIFVKESYQELLHKVTWPKYSDLQNSAILVLVASLIFALLIFGIDSAFKNFMEFVYEDL